MRTVRRLDDIPGFGIDRVAAAAGDAATSSPPTSSATRVPIWAKLLARRSSLV